MLSRITQRHTLFAALSLFSKKNKDKIFSFFWPAGCVQAIQLKPFPFSSFFFRFVHVRAGPAHESANGRGHHIHFTHPIFILGPSIVWSCCVCPQGIPVPAHVSKDSHHGSLINTSQFFFGTMGPEKKICATFAERYEHLVYCSIDACTLQSYRQFQVFVTNGMCWTRG